MKLNLPAKRILASLPIVLVYTFIFAIVGNCEDYSQTQNQIEEYGTQQEEVISSDTYYEVIPDSDEKVMTYQIGLRKAGISEYSIFDDYENVTMPAVTTEKTIKETTASVVTTSEQTPIETVETTSEQKNFSIKPQENAVNSGDVVASNPAPAHSEEVTMTVSVGGQVVTLPAYDVVCSLLQQELSNGTPEAMKAQAVAAYTYHKYYESRGSYKAVNVLPMSSINQSVKNAVSQVLGICIYYNNSPILATYSAATGGATASAKDVWGTGIPYLVSVESKYDNLASSAYYNSTKTFSEEQVRQIIEDNTNITLSNNPLNWFTFLGADQGGILDGNYIGKMLIDGNSSYVNNSGKTVTITGRVIRENLFNLKSSKFEIAYNNGTFIFTTYGYGHGVGLSQIGANLYSTNEGWTYDQILKHYFTGVEVK